MDKKNYIIYSFFPARDDKIGKRSVYSEYCVPTGLTLYLR